MSKRNGQKARRRLADLVAVAGTLASAGTAWAGPEGEMVVHGQASFERMGPVTNITAGHNAIINYRSFDIGAQETVRFIQPDASSRVLNRIQSQTPTRIDGSLMANGHVYLLNPSGVIFSRTAMINVGGLHAAAASLSDEDFLRRADRFTNIRGGVVNEGLINATSDVHLVGRYVANSGVINAQRAVVMAAGDSVLIGEVDGHTYVKIESGRMDEVAEATRSGGLGTGDMYSLAIRHSGKIRAKQAHLENGNAGRAARVEVTGPIDVSNPGGVGGRVEILGEHISLRGADINASGAAGGGTVLVGGEYRGSGDVRRAKTLNTDQATTIAADATEKGAGGRVILWSDLHTRFGAQLSAKGGAGGGDGGFVEASGKDRLTFAGGFADLTAAKGKTGTFLLDPATLNIVDSAAALDWGPTQIGVDNLIASGDADINTNRVSWGTIVGFGATANVRLEATGNITIENVTGAAGGSITAANLVTLPFTTGGLTLQSTGGSITFADTADTIRTQGGFLSFLGGASNDSLTLGNIETNGGAVVLEVDGNINVGTINAVGGVVLLRSTSNSATFSVGTITGGNVRLLLSNSFTSTNPINATTLALSGTNFDLDGVDNAIGTVGANLSGNNRTLAVRDDGGLIIGSAADSQATTIDGITNTGSNGVVSITSNGSVTQTSVGVVNTDTLLLAGTGSFELGTAVNDVNIIRGTGLGSLTLSSTGNLQVGTGGVTSTADTALTVLNGGTLNVANAINVRTLTLSADEMALGSTLTAGNMTLRPNDPNRATNVANGNDGLDLALTDLTTRLTVGGILSLGRSDGTGQTTLGAAFDVSGLYGLALVGGNPAAAGVPGVAINAALTATGRNVVISSADGATQSAVLTANGLLVEGTGLFDLSTQNNVIGTMAANLTDAAAGLALRDDANIGIGTVAGFNGIVSQTGQSGSVRLLSGGAVTQTQPILRTRLAATGAGTYTLTDAGNDITALAADLSGATTLSARNVASIDAVTVGAATTADLSVTGGTVALEIGGTGLTQNARLRATNLLITGTGNATLLNAGNEVGTIASSMTGVSNLAFRDDGGFTVGTVGGTSGISLPTINAGVLLSSAGAVALGAGANDTIVTDRLALTGAGGDFDLTARTIFIDSLAADTTGAAGNSVRLLDTNAGFTIASLTIGGTTINGLLAEAATLDQNATVTQTAPVIVGSLRLLPGGASGSYQLESQANQITDVAAVLGPNSVLALRSDVAMQIVDAGAGVGLQAQTIGLTGSGGVTQGVGAPIIATNLISRGTGTVSLLDAGNQIANVAAVLSDNGSFLLNDSAGGLSLTDVTAGTLTSQGINGSQINTLVSLRTITQITQAQPIITGDLNVRTAANGSVLLGQNNNVRRLSIDMPGTSVFTYAQLDGGVDLEIANVGGTNGIQMPGGRLNLGSTPSRTTTQTAPINALSMRVTGGGRALLNGANNDVGQVAADLSGAGARFAFRDDTGFAIATLDGTEGLRLDPALDSAVLLNSGGTVTQAGTADIVARGLVVTGGGSFDLTNGGGGNNVGVLAGALTNGLVRLTQASDVRVGSVTVGSTTFTGLNLGATGTAALRSTGGSVAQDEPILGGSVRASGNAVTLANAGNTFANVSAVSTAGSVSVLSTAATLSLATVDGQNGIGVTGGTATITAPSVNIAVNSASDGEFILQPVNPAATVGINNAGSQFNLLDADIRTRITAPTVVVGRSDGTGAFTLNGANLVGGPASLRAQGGAMTVQGANAVTGTLRLVGLGITQTGGSVQAGDLSIASTGLNNNVTMTAGSNQVPAVTATVADGNLEYNSAINFNVNGASVATSAGARTVTVRSIDGLVVRGDVTNTSGGLTELHAGTDGTGDLSFNSGGRVLSNSIRLRAGNGIGGGNTALVDARTNAPRFRNGAGTANPTSFEVRQDAAVASALLPDPAQVGGGATQFAGGSVDGLVYFVRSDDGSIAFGDAVIFQGSRLALTTLGAQASNINVSPQVRSLTINGRGEVNASMDIIASEAGTGSLVFNGPLDLNTNIVQLIGDEIDINGAMDSGAGATLRILSRTDGFPIRLGGANAGGELNLTQADLLNLPTLGSAIGIGATTPRNAMTLDTADLSARTYALSLLGGSFTSANGTTFRAPSGVVTIDSTGGTALAGAYIGQQLNLTGNGTFNLDNAANDLAVLQAAITGVLNFRDANAVTLGGTGLTTGGSNATIRTGGLLTIDRPINVGAGTLTLNTGGVTQIATGPITATTIDLLGVGDVLLNAVPNNATTLSGNLTGAVRYRDADSINIGASGLSTGGNQVSINAPTSIDVQGNLNAGAGDITLTTASGTRSAGAITGNVLTLSGGPFILGNGHDVNTLLVATGGAVSFGDSDDLSVGLSDTGGGDLTLNSVGNMTIVGAQTGVDDASYTTNATLAFNQPVSANTVFASGLTVSQLNTGTITTPTLTVGGGTVSLGANNAVTNFGGTVGSDISFFDVDGFNTELLSAGTSIALQAGGPITLGGDLATGTAFLTAAGVAQNAGVMTISNQLALGGTGTFVFDLNGNSIAQVRTAGFNGPLTLRTGGTLDIASVDTSSNPAIFRADNINSSAGLAASTATFEAGNVTQAAGGPIFATVLTLTLTGDATLNSPTNQVGTLTGSAAGDIALRNATALTVSALSGRQITAASDVGLTADGVIAVAAGRTLRLTSGATGAGNLAFNAAATLRGDTIELRAGDGAAGGNASLVDALTNAPTFANAAGTGAPASFAVRQDSTIADAQTADAAQFAATAADGLVYTLTSDAGSVTIATPSKFAGSVLTLDAQAVGQAGDLASDIVVRSFTSRGLLRFTGNRVLTATTGTITVNNGLDAGANGVTMRADEIDLAGAAAGAGSTLALEPLNAGNGVDIGGAGNAAGVLDLTGADMAAFAAYPGVLTIGRADGTGLVRSVGAASVGGGLSLLSNAGTGAIAINAPLTSTGAMTLDSATGTNLAAGLTGGSVTINDPVTLGATSTVTTTGGDASINGTINAAAAGGQGLTINAGAGQVLLGGAAVDQAIGATFEPASLTLTGATVRTPTMRVSGPVQLNGSADLRGDITTVAPTGSLTLNNGGSYTGNRGLFLAGAFIHNGATLSGLNNLVVNAQSAAINAPLDVGQTLSIITRDGVNIASVVRAGTNASIQSGSDGTGDLRFTAGGAGVRSPRITLVAGDGAGGTNTAIVDALTNAPVFADAGGLGSPSFFTIRQDAAIANANMPNVGQFASGLGGIDYTLRSDASSITLTDATKVNGASVLRLIAANGISMVPVSVGQIILEGTVGNGGDVDITNSNGGGSIVINAAQNFGAGNVSFTADEIEILATLAGTGPLTLQPFTVNRETALGGVPDETRLDLETVEIGRLANGFQRITVGRANGEGPVRVVGATTYLDPAVLRSGGAAGTVSIESPLAGTGDASIEVQDTGAGTTLSSTITTAGQSVTINDTLNVGADASITSAGGLITLRDAVDAAAAGVQGLTLDAGAGNVNVGADVGATRNLRELRSTAAQTNVRNVTTTVDQVYTGALSNSVAALLAGRDISVTGATIVTGGDLEFRGRTMSLGPVRSGGTPRGLTMTPTADGVADFFGDVGGAGAGEALSFLTVSNLGATRTRTAIRSTGPVNIANALTLVGDTSITTQNGSVTLASVTGARDLRITTGSGPVTLNAINAIGDGVGPALSVSSTGLTRFDGVSSFNSGVSISGPAAINANVSVLGGDTASTFNGATTLNNVAIVSVPGVTFGDDAGDAITVLGSSSVTTTAGAIGFTGPTDGAGALTANSGTSALTFAAVGSTTPLASLTATGGTIAAPSVATTGAQSYTGTTSIAGAASTTGGNVSFSGFGSAGSISTAGGSVTGNNSLTVTGATNTAGGGVTVAGNAILGAVTTAGGNLALQSNATLNGPVSTGSGNINVTGTTNAAAPISTTTGAIAFGGPATVNSTITTAGGSVTGNNSLAVTGDVNTGGGAVAVTGPATFGSALNTAGGNVTLSSSATLASVNVGSGTLLASGPTTASGAIQGTTGSLTFNGTSTLNGPLSSTTGAISFGGPATVNNTLTTTGGSVNASNTLAVTGATNTGGGSVTVGGDATLAAVTTAGGNLTLQSNATLNGPVSVGSGNINVAGTTLAQSTIEATSGSVLFNGPATLNGAVTMGGGQLTGNSSLNANAAVNTGGGAVAVTGPAAFASTLATGGGSANFASSASFNGAVTTGAGSIAVAGPATLLAPLTTTTGAVAFNGGSNLGANITTAGGLVALTGPVTLTTPVSIATGGGAFTATGRVDSDATPRALTINTGAGEASLALGSANGLGATSRLASLSVTGATIRVGNATTVGTQTFNGATTLSGGLTTFGGAVTVNGASNVLGNPGVSTSGGNIAFNGTVDSDPVGPSSLALDAGSGTVDLPQAVGSVRALSTITLAGATKRVNAITTVGDQLHDGNTIFSGPLASTGTGTITLGGTPTLATDLVVTTGGNAVVSGTPQSQGGARDLTVNAAGVTRFDAVPSAANPLDDITLGGGGTTVLEVASLRAPGRLTITDGLRINRNTTLVGSNVLLGGVENTTTAGTADLVVLANSGGTIDLTGPIGNGGGFGQVGRLLVGADGTQNAQGIPTGNVSRIRLGAASVVVGPAIFGGSTDVLSGASASVRTTSPDSLEEALRDAKNVWGDILFRGPVNSADPANPGRLAVATDPQGGSSGLITPANALNTENPRVKFNGSIGANTPLRSFEVNADGRGTPPLTSTVVIHDQFDTIGRIATAGFRPASDLQIGVTESLVIGSGEKLLAFGNLRIRNTAAGATTRPAVTLADTTVVGGSGVAGTLTVDASAITVAGRRAGTIVDFQGSTGDDDGTDLVTTGGVIFNLTPSIDGGSGLFGIASDSGVPTDNLRAFPTQVFKGGIDSDLFTRSALVAGADTQHLGFFDLRAQGLTLTNVASSIAGAVPQADTGQVQQSATVSGGVLDDLLEMGINARGLAPEDLISFLVGRSLYNDVPRAREQTLAGGNNPLPDLMQGDFSVSVNRLPTGPVQQALATYQSLAYRMKDNPDGGEPTREARLDELKQAMSDAWEGYRLAMNLPEGEEPDARKFGSWLCERGPALEGPESQALEVLEKLDQLFIELDQLGLSPVEVEISKGAILGNLTPGNMGPDAIREAIAGAGDLRRCRPAPTITARR